MGQICSQCNAPLSLDPALAVAKCAYCGTDNRVAESAGPPELERLVEKAVANVGVGVRLNPARLTSDQQKFFAGIRANGEARVAAAKRWTWLSMIVLAVILLFTAVAVILGVLHAT
jgi:hypothetical protein